MYTFFLQKFRIAEKRLEETESTDDVFEKDDLAKINMKDLFLLQLPQNGPCVVYYASGNLAISQTSNGYVALFENVSLL